MYSVQCAVLQSMGLHDIIYPLGGFENYYYSVCGTSTPKIEFFPVYEINFKIFTSVQ